MKYTTRIHQSCHISFAGRPIRTPGTEPTAFAAQERHVPLRWAQLYRPPGSDDPWL
jgi:hypothetical protein